MRFKVYDEVWSTLGLSPEPKRFIVFAVVEEMAHMKAGKTELHYRIVPDQVGATFENSIRRDPDELFASKAELVAAYVKANA